MKKLIGKEYADGTMERYKITLKHISEFLMWKYNVSDIDILKIDLAF